MREQGKGQDFFLPRWWVGKSGENGAECRAACLCMFFYHRHRGLAVSVMNGAFKGLACYVMGQGGKACGIYKLSWRPEDNVG